MVQFEVQENPRTERKVQFGVHKIIGKNRTEPNFNNPKFKVFIAGILQWLSLNIVRLRRKQYFSSTEVLKHLPGRQCLRVVLPQHGALCKVNLQVDAAVHGNWTAETLSTPIDT